MRSFLLLFWLSLGLPWSAPAQTLNGKVILGPNVTDPPLGGVRVEVTDFTTATSDPETGTFSLQLPGLRPGAKVPLDLVKPGYAVINREATQPRLPDHPLERTVVHMAPQAQRDEMALAFYRITVERNIQVNFDSAAKRFAQDANYEAIGKLHREKETALNLADSLAARLARFDPQTASDELTRAMQLYQEGKVQAALDILDADKIAARIAARKEVMAEMTEANAQDIQALLQAAEMAISDFQFEKATAYYQAAVDADTTNAENLEAFGYYLSNQNQNDRAIQYFQSGLRHVKDSMERCQLSLKLANSYSLNNQYNKALAMYQSLENLVPASFQKDSVRGKRFLALTYQNYSTLLIFIGDTVGSVEMMNRSIQLSQQLYDQDPSHHGADLASGLRALIPIHALAGNTDSAQKTFFELLDLLDEGRSKYKRLFVADIDEDLANLAGNIGAVFYLEGDYETALNYFQLAVEMLSPLTKQNPDKYNPELSDFLNNIGLVKLDLKKPNEAVNAHKKAVFIRLQLARDVHSYRFAPKLAESYANLGVAYKRTDSLQAAILNYQSADSIYRYWTPRIELEMGNDMARNLTNMGLAYGSNRQFNSAYQCYKEASAIYRSMPFKDTLTLSLKYLNILNNQAYVIREWIRITPSYDLQKKGLDICRRIDSVLETFSSYANPTLAEYETEVDSHRTWINLPGLLGQLHYDIAWALYKSGHSDSAIYHFKKAVEDLDNFPKDSLDLYANLDGFAAYANLIAIISDDKINYDYQKKAIGYLTPLTRLLPGNEEIQGYEESAYFNLSWYALFVGEFKEAETSARRTLELAPASTGVISNLAAALLLQGKFEKAKQWYLDYADQPWPDERHETFREVFLADWEELEAAGVTHPDVAKIRALLRP